MRDGEKKRGMKERGKRQGREGEAVGIGTEEGDPDRGLAWEK